MAGHGPATALNPGYLAGARQFRMGPAVARAACCADMARRVGAHRKQGTPGAVPADGTGSIRQGVKVAAEPRGSVLAARSGNHIGHELGASGGQQFILKDGGGTGGSVPSWLPDAPRCQRWVVASCDTLAKASVRLWPVISAAPIPCQWNRVDVPLRMATMARLIPLGGGISRAKFFGIMQCPSSYGIGLIPVQGQPSG